MRRERGEKTFEPIAGNGFVMFHIRSSIET
jgi:hypothetical protein